MNRVLSLIAALLLCCTAACRRSPSYYLDKGNQLLAKQQYADAALNYKKALQADPSFGEAHYQLARVDLHLNKAKEAYEALSRAVELLPARDDVKVALGDLCLSGYLADRNRPKVLYDQMGRISDQLLAKNPRSYDGLRFKAYLAVADRRLADAEKFFQMANGVKPTQPDLIAAWSEVLFQDNQFGEGEKLALQLIAKNKSYGPIYDELFRRYMLAKRVTDAEKILKTKVRNNPSDPRFAIQLATFYAQASRNEEMQAVLKRMLEDPAVVEAHLYAGDFYAGIQRWEDAVAEFEQGADANPREKVTYQKRIANVRLAQGKGEQAAQLVASILKEQPADEAAKGVRASLLLASQQPEKVAAAVSQFQALTAKSPDNAIWRFNLGLALAAKGDVEGARRQFQEAIAKRADFLPPRLALAEQSRVKGDYQTALRYQNEILALRPNLPTIRLDRAVSLANVGRDIEARRELINLEKIFPYEVELQFAMLDLRQRDFKQAEDRFQRLLTRNQGNSRVVSGLAQTYAAQDQVDKAVRLLQDELKRSPDSDAARSLLAQIAFQSGQYDQAIEHYRHLLAMRPQSAQLHMEIGAAYQSKGDFPNAIANFQKACSLAPADPVPLCLLGEALSASGKKREALDIFRRAVRLKPDYPPALNDLAFQLAEFYGDLDEALELAQKSLHIAPDQPGALDTLGWIYVKKHFTDGAIQSFQRLTEKYPDNAEFRYHFGMALLQKGDLASAREQFQVALGKRPPAEMRQKIETGLGELPVR